VGDSWKTLGCAPAVENWVYIDNIGMGLDPSMGVSGAERVINDRVKVKNKVPFILPVFSSLQSTCPNKQTNWLLNSIGCNWP
jgi:hypothetical protein